MFYMVLCIYPCKNAPLCKWKLFKTIDANGLLQAAVRLKAMILKVDEMDS